MINLYSPFRLCLDIGKPEMAYLYTTLNERRLKG